MTLATEFAPTAPLRAINKNRLVRPDQTLHQMAGRLGKITDVGREQAAQYRVLQCTGNDLAGQNHNALARKSLGLLTPNHAETPVA